MRKKRLVRALACALTCAAIGRSARAEPRTPAPRFVASPESKLWLEGESTLHSFKITASTMAVSVAAVGAPGETLPEEIAGRRIRTVDVSIPVSGLTSGEAGLDSNMRKALDAREHPEIRFRLTTYRAPPSGEASEKPVPIQATGDLEIAGKTRTVELDALASYSGGRERIAGSKDLLMSDFGVKPPKFMGGMLKARDRVVVHYELVLEAE